MNTELLKIVGPRRRGAGVKGPNVESTSSNELGAESRADEAQSSGHHERLPLYAFIDAQMHLPLPLLLLLLRSWLSRTKGTRCYTVIFQEGTKTQPEREMGPTKVLARQMGFGYTTL